MSAACASASRLGTSSASSISRHAVATAAACRSARVRAHSGGSACTAEIPPVRRRQRSRNATFSRRAGAPRTTGGNRRGRPHRIDEGAVGRVIAPLHPRSSARHRRARARRFRARCHQMQHRSAPSGWHGTVPPLPEQSRDRRTASTPVLALKTKHRPATRKPQPARLPDRSTALQFRPLTRPALSCPSAARKPDETHDLLASKAYFLRLVLGFWGPHGPQRPSQ